MPRRHIAAVSKVTRGSVKRQIILHVVRLDVLLHALGGFAEPAPLPTYFWTPQEDEYLRRAYTFVGMHELLDRLPRRTPGTIRKRACDLGLTRPKRRAVLMRDALRSRALSGATPGLLAQGASTMIRRHLSFIIAAGAPRLPAHGASLAQGVSPARALDLADRDAAPVGRGSIDGANTLGDRL